MTALAGSDVLKQTCHPRHERSHQGRSDLAVERYLAGGFDADCRHRASYAAAMFVVPGAATAIAWTTASHNVQANKPWPLGLIGGST